MNPWILTSLSWLLFTQITSTGALEAETILQEETTKWIDWNGTQKTFGEFRRLSTTDKARIRSFQLSQTENLDVNDLLDELRPCSTLEFLRLDEVELTGRFPNTTSRISLPNLQQFQIKLTYPPYPPQSLTCADYGFFDKQDLDLFQAEVNFKIEVGGYVLCELDYAYGEFLMSYNESSLVSEFLQSQGLGLIPFSLKELTLKGNDIQVSLIPEDLSFLQLMYNQINDEATYNGIITKSKRLRHLYLASNEWEQHLALDLDRFPKSLESLSLENFSVNYTRKPSFYNLKNVYMKNCNLEEEEILNQVDLIFPRIEKFGISFVDSSGNQCYDLLNRIIFSDVYPQHDTLEFILIENCNRTAENFDKVEAFLSSIGISKMAVNFILIKKVDWTGYTSHDVLPGESKRIQFDMTRLDKLETWENFKNM